MKLRNDAKMEIDLTQENVELLDLIASSRKTTPKHDRHQEAFELRMRNDRSETLE